MDSDGKGSQQFRLVPPHIRGPPRTHAKTDRPTADHQRYRVALTFLLGQEVPSVPNDEATGGEDVYGENVRNWIGVVGARKRKAANHVGEKGREAWPVSAFESIDGCLLRGRKWDAVARIRDARARRVAIAQTSTRVHSNPDSIRSERPRRAPNTLASTLDSTLLDKTRLDSPPKSSVTRAAHLGAIRRFPNRHRPRDRFPTTPC